MKLLIIIMMLGFFPGYSQDTSKVDNPLKALEGTFKCLFIPVQQDWPVRFNYYSTKVGDNTYELHIRSYIEIGWHIYAQKQPKDAIAFPTSITFVGSPLFSLIGIPREDGELKIDRVESLGITQNEYETFVDFIQKVKLRNSVRMNICGRIKFQACTNEHCLPAKEVNFSIPVNP